MQKVLGLHSYAQYTKRFSLHVFFCWFLSIKQPHSLILTLSYNNVISGNATDNILFLNFKSTFILRILSQPIFQCYLQNETQFHQSVIVAILYYSANLILTLSYLAKTPQLKYAYYSNAKQQAVTCGQILEHLSCNFIRTRVLLYVSLCQRRTILHFKGTTVVLYSFSLIYNMCFSKSPGTEIGSIVFSP